MTPYLLKLHIDAYTAREDERRNLTAWQIWHGEALARMKKLPAFDTLLVKKKELKKGIDEKAIMQGMKAYQRNREKIKGK